MSGGVSKYSGVGGGTKKFVINEEKRFRVCYVQSFCVQVGHAMRSRYHVSVRYQRSAAAPKYTTVVPVQTLVSEGHHPRPRA